MEISPILQARLALLGGLLGIVLGLLFDVSFVICHTVEKRKILLRMLRFALDVCICLFAGAGIILLSYYFNYGEVRGFCIFGALLGFVAWRVSLSRPTRYVLSAVQRLSRAIIRAVLTPFAKIFVLLIKILQKILYYVWKSLANIFRLVYNNIYNTINMRSVLKRARRGFL